MSKLLTSSLKNYVAQVPWWYLRKGIWSISEKVKFKISKNFQIRKHQESKAFYNSKQNYYCSYLVTQIVSDFKQIFIRPLAFSFPLSLCSHLYSAIMGLKNHEVKNHYNNTLFGSVYSTPGLTARNFKHLFEENTKRKENLLAYLKRPFKWCLPNLSKKLPVVFYPFQ